MPSASSRRSEVFEETLASRLALGPLPLPVALRCATDVAAALRELHQEGRTHGDVSPDSIVLRPGGAALLPTSHLYRETNLRADVAAFGALLYEMLTGGKPPRSGPLAASVEHAPHTGAAALRAAALRLAARCLGEPAGQAPSIQMVVTEVRLLSVLARQSQPEPFSPPQPAPLSRTLAPRAPAPETRRSASPLAEWPAAAASPARKPPPAAHAAPAESFVRGVPTKEFVSAMLAPESDPSLEDLEPAAGLPEENLEGDEGHEEEIAEHPPTPLEKCPKCGSSHVHPSKPHTKFEFLLTNLGIPVCRCHRCYHRYVVIFRFAFPKMPSR